MSQDSGLFNQLEVKAKKYNTRSHVLPSYARDLKSPTLSRLLGQVVLPIKQATAGELGRAKHVQSGWYLGARLVARGFAECLEVHFNETFSPVTLMTSMRHVLAIMARNGMHTVYGLHTVLCHISLSRTLHTHSSHQSRTNWFGGPFEIFSSVIQKNLFTFNSHVSSGNPQTFHQPCSTEIKLFANKYQNIV